MKRVGFLAALLLVAGVVTYWKTAPKGTDATKSDALAAAPATSPAQTADQTPAPSRVPSATNAENSAAPSTGKPDSGANSALPTSPPVAASSVPAHDARPPAPAADAARSIDPKASIDPALAKTLNLQFQSQRPDADWAPAAEQQLHRYLDGMDGDIQERIEILGVECRKTLCQIQAASKTLGNTDRDARDWHETVYGMPLQPWWVQYQFKQPQTVLSTVPQGARLLFITYLLRAQPSEEGAK